MFDDRIAMVTLDRVYCYWCVIVTSTQLMKMKNENLLPRVDFDCHIVTR